VTVNRARLYRFPWSRSDNAGGWVEVTDECSFSCPGCYRHKLEGHRPLADVEKDILDCRRLTNCDGMAIAGGEPLGYPRILDVVSFMSRRGIKPTLISNGDLLTRGMARDLKKAGLAKIHLHIDSAQKRPGWEGKNETELNDLRQRYADLLWDIGGIQCGYHTTVFRETIDFIPEITAWCRRNVHKVQHMSFIAFRTLPLEAGLEYYAGGHRVDLQDFCDERTKDFDIGITAEDMAARIEDRWADFAPAAFLNGSTAVGVAKYLIGVYVGSASGVYGVLGPKSVELVQTMYHLFKGRYLSFLRKPVVGKKIFALSVVDPMLRQTFGRFVRACAGDPRHLVSRVYTQSIHLHRPSEVLNAQADFCDSCLNMMAYKARLIPSCRLDDYRLYGAPLMPVAVNGLAGGESGAGAAGEV
jgi:pyruvate-formate lyase-activating enzyme